MNGHGFVCLLLSSGFRMWSKGSPTTGTEAVSQLTGRAAEATKFALWFHDCLTTLGTKCSPSGQRGAAVDAVGRNLRHAGGTGGRSWVDGLEVLPYQVGHRRPHGCSHTHASHAAVTPQLVSCPTQDVVGLSLLIVIVEGFHLLPLTEHRLELLNCGVVLWGVDGVDKKIDQLDAIGSKEILEPLGNALG